MSGKPEPGSETLLSTADVARLADVTPDTVREWENRGRLHADRTAGGIRLFRRADVDAFLASRREAAK